jgi:Zn-dependent peptidase ImmA (M78 family)
VLPPNPKRWEQEHNALDLRHELSMTVDERLSPEKAFELLESVAGVMPHTKLKVNAATMSHFTGKNSKKWSGMCIPLPDGGHLVVYNEDHPQTRVRATLMEEFFHLWLEHQPTKLRFLSDGAGSRTYNADVEEEAYGSGAAALVPYKPLREMLGDGLTRGQIAQHFHVSEQLVEFRTRVSKIGLRRRT